jgi:hypothetical protein
VGADRNADGALVFKDIPYTAPPLAKNPMFRVFLNGIACQSTGKEILLLGTIHKERRSTSELASRIKDTWERNPWLRDFT